MYTLVDTCLSKIDIFEFLSYVISGLSDESQEIKVLNYMMLQRLAASCPTAVSHKLDDIIAPLKSALLTKAKANAVKQELERGKELIRSAARTTLILQKLASESQKFGAFVEEMRSPSSGIADILESVDQEMAGQNLNRSHSTHDMEI